MTGLPEPFKVTWIGTEVLGRPPDATDQSRFLGQFKGQILFLGLAEICFDGRANEF